jgi:hypothetical protein
VLCQLSYSHRNFSIIATEVVSEIATRSAGLTGSGGCAAVLLVGNQSTDVLDASDADIFESECAQARGVEQVLGIDDHRRFQ